MKLILTLAALALPLCAQVVVSVSVASKAATAKLLNGRIAKVARVAIVSMDNSGAEPVAVSESAVLRHVPQLGPIDHATMSLLIDEGAQNSGWARAGRIGQDLTQLATFLAASKQIRIGEPALTGLTAFTALSPYFIQRLRGVERPVRQNFEALTWREPVTLQPGDSATERIFVTDGAGPATFTIDISRLKQVKLIQ